MSPGLFCLREVAVRWIAAASADGAAIDVNMRISAALQNERRKNGVQEHLVETHTCQRREEDLFVVMERCEGNLLELVQAIKLRDRHRFSWLRDESDDTVVIKNVCHQLCSALAALHTRGAGSYSSIVHNSLKPANVLLRADMVKIAELKGPVHVNDDGVLIGAALPSSDPWGPCPRPELYAARLLLKRRALERLHTRALLAMPIFSGTRLRDPREHSSAAGAAFWVRSLTSNSIGGVELTLSTGRPMPPSERRKVNSTSDPPNLLLHHHHRRLLRGQVL